MEKVTWSDLAWPGVIRTCSRETDEKFAKACMLAKLCTFAAEEVPTPPHSLTKGSVDMLVVLHTNLLSVVVNSKFLSFAFQLWSQVLPSPEQFFISKKLWPDQGEPQLVDFCQLFLYIALEKWLARLSQEAAKEVPPVAMAVGAAQRLKELRKRDEHGLRAVSPCNESHPLTLLQQLPGGEPAVKAILQAKHKAQQMEVESQIMRICCGPLEDEDDAVTAKVPTILDEVSETGARKCGLMARRVWTVNLHPSWSVDNIKKTSTYSYCSLLESSWEALSTTACNSCLERWRASSMLVLKRPASARDKRNTKISKTDVDLI